MNTIYIYMKIYFYTFGDWLRHQLFFVGMVPEMTTDCDKDVIPELHCKNVPNIPDIDVVLCT